MGIALYRMINFNTNVLETNIINLSVVVGCLVYFGSDVLNSLLDDRMAIIMRSLDEVKALKENLNEITEAPSTADSLAQDLAKSENDLNMAIERMRTEIKNRYTKEISDLETGKTDKISFEEEKATSQLSEQIKNLTVQLSILQIENRIIKARGNMNLGLISDYEQSITFNRGKKYGYFFKDSLRKLAQLAQVSASD